jgi:serine/threonine protein phosphatase PrpC
MGINKNNLKITKDEASLLIKASEDFSKYGTTLITCPRCGSKLIQEITGNSGTVRCEKEDCLKITLRGL